MKIRILIILANLPCIALGVLLKINNRTYVVNLLIVIKMYNKRQCNVCV